MKETKDRENDVKGEKSREVKEKEIVIQKKMMGGFFLSALPSFHSSALKQHYSSQQLTRK
jgi:hypothetical protein